MGLIAAKERQASSLIRRIQARLGSGLDISAEAGPILDTTQTALSVRSQNTIVLAHGNLRLLSVHGPIKAPHIFVVGLVCRTSDFVGSNVGEPGLFVLQRVGSARRIIRRLVGR